MDNKKIIAIVIIAICCIVMFFGIAFGGVFALVGGGFKVEAGSREDEFNDFKKDACKATGKIVSSYDGETIVKFEAEDGEEYQLSYSSSSSSLRSGQKVDVYYDEDNPDYAITPQIEIDILKNLGNVFFTIGIVVLIVGIAIGVIGIIVGCAMLSKIKKQQDSYNAMNSGANYGNYNGMM